jgi:hypothetical protein
MEEKRFCNDCGNSNQDKFEWRGKLDNGARRYRCNDCGKWGNTGDGAEKAQDGGLYSFVDNGASAEASAVLDMDTIRSPQALIEAMNIDESVWEIYKKQVGKQAAWRKDREVIWKVENNRVLEGSVRDSGKIKIVPLFNVKVWMRRKTEEIRTNFALEDLRKGLKDLTIKRTVLKFKENKKGMLFEVEMPDIHLGKLTWGEESGEDSDISTQVADVKKVATELLSHTKNYPVEKILLPLGNDYYNVDNNLGTTTHGTPQQEDTRWRKSFAIGWELASDLIEMCLQVAPVDVLIVGGNHDEQRSFYLGEVLSALYQDSKHVKVDNSAKLRKYYVYGKNLIGLTHGYHEKTKDLRNLMAVEVPKKWASTKFREWHTGDKHHKEDWVHKTHEANSGVVVRILRSLTTPDAWHYNKGYVGVLRASEAFLWDKNEGLKAQFTATP